MLTTVLFIAGIAVILLIARYNQSNKLFWTLLMAMLAGFVGGTIATKIATNNSSEHTGLYQSVPTQGSDLQAVGMITSRLAEDQDILAYAKPMSQAYFEPTTNSILVPSQRTSSNTKSWLVGANPEIAMNLFDTS